MIRIWEEGVAQTHRRGLLGEFSVQSVREALNKRVSSGNHHTAVQTLGVKRSEAQEEFVVLKRGWRYGGKNWRMDTFQKSSDDITVMDGAGCRHSVLLRYGNNPVPSSIDTSQVKQVVHWVTFNPLLYLCHQKLVNIHRPDVDVTHSHAGRNNMANSQHGVSRQALEQTEKKKITKVTHWSLKQENKSIFTTEQYSVSELYSYRQCVHFWRKMSESQSQVVKYQTCWVGSSFKTV